MRISPRDFHALIHEPVKTSILRCGGTSTITSQSLFDWLNVCATVPVEDVEAVSDDEDEPDCDALAEADEEEVAAALLEPPWHSASQRCWLCCSANSSPTRCRFR